MSLGVMLISLHDFSRFSIRNDDSLAGDEPGGEGVSDQDNTTVPATIASDSSESTRLTHNSDDNTLRSGDRRPSITATGTGQQHGDIHRGCTIAAASSRQHEGIRYHRSSTAVTGDDLHRYDFHKHSEVIGGGGGSELVGGEVDLDNLEDFDDNLYDEMEMETEGAGEVLDVPGHQEWPQDNDFQLQEHDAVNEDFSTKATHSSETFGRESNTGKLEVSTSCSHSRMESSAPKTKLSLRQQKSGKTRVCELDQGGGGERRESQRVKNPPVASVKPIQQQPLPQKKVKHEVVAPSSSMLTESELYEEPFVLSSIPEVENNSWKLRPFVKIKVQLYYGSMSIYLP